MHRSKPSCNEQAKSGFCHRATNSSISAFNACVLNSSDYYLGACPAAGGRMQMPGRSVSGEYRFGFNGMKKDDELYGAGNHYTAPFWEYVPRVATRCNPDDSIDHIFYLDKHNPTKEYKLHSQAGDTIGFKVLEISDGREVYDLCMNPEKQRQYFEKHYKK